MGTSITHVWHGMEELPRLQVQWDDLARSFSPPAFYFASRFSDLWYRSFGLGRPVRILAVEDKNRLRLVAPFFKASGFWTTFAADDADHPLVLFRAGDREAVELFWKVVAKDLGKVKVPNVGVGSELLRAAPGARKKTAGQRTYFLEPDIARVGNRMRVSHYKWAISGLKRMGELEYTHISSRERILDLLPAFLGLHIARWRNTTTPSVFEQEHFRKYCVSLVEELAPDFISLDALLLDGKLISGFLGTEMDTRKSLYMATYDIELPKYSPGKLLMAFTVERARKVGLTRIDLLRGAEQYKSRYKPQVEPYVDLTLGPLFSLDSLFVYLQTCLRRPTPSHQQLDRQVAFMLPHCEQVKPRGDS